MNLLIVLLLVSGSSEVLSVAAPDVGMLTSGESSQFYNSTISAGSAPQGWLLFSSSGLPDHPTFKVNPNNVTAQNYQYMLPANQTANATLSLCVNLGVVGFMKNGVPIYNALNAPMDGSLDAVKNEVFDNCSGHPDVTGAYHYHQLPACVSHEVADEFLGVAIDGYPIYGPNASDIPGRLLNSSDLDACHGRFRGGRYMYYITKDFPYTIGCFRGVVGYNNASAPAGAGGPGGSSGVSGVSGAGGLGAASCTSIAANGGLCDCTIGVVSARDVAQATSTSRLTSMSISISTSNQSNSNVALNNLKSAASRLELLQPISMMAAMIAAKLQ